MNKIRKDLEEIRDHFKAMKEIDDQGKWDEYIAKLDKAEKILLEEKI